MSTPIQSKKRFPQPSAELDRRINDYAYNGRDPTGVAEAISALNGESVLALKFQSTQPTPVVSTGTNTVGLIGLDANNVIQVPGPHVPANAVNIGNGGDVTINGQIQAPAMYKTVTYNDTLNASIGTTPFFIADQAYTVIGVNYVNKTAGTGTGTVTVTKDTGTAIPGGGTALLTAPISVTAVANTVTPGTLIASGSAALTLAAGDRLSALFAGTLTTLAGVVITVTLQATTTQSPLRDRADFLARERGYRHTDCIPGKPGYGRHGYQGDLRDCFRCGDYHRRDEGYRNQRGWRWHNLPRGDNGR